MQQAQSTAATRGLMISKSGDVRVGHVVQVDRDTFGTVLKIEPDRLICESFPPGEFFKVDRDPRIEQPENPNEPHNGMALWKIDGIVVNPAFDEDGDVYSAHRPQSQKVGLIVDVLRSKDERVPLDQMALIIGWHLDEARSHLSWDTKSDDVAWTRAVEFILSFVEYEIVTEAMDVIGSGQRLNPQYGPTSITIELPKFIVSNIAAEAENNSLRSSFDDELYNMLWDTYGDDPRPPYEAEWPTDEEGGAS